MGSTRSGWGGRGKEGRPKKRCTTTLLLRLPLQNELQSDAMAAWWALFTWQRGPYPDRVQGGATPWSKEFTGGKKEGTYSPAARSLPLSTGQGYATGRDLERLRLLDACSLGKRVPWLLRGMSQDYGRDPERRLRVCSVRTRDFTLDFSQLRPLGKCSEESGKT